MCGKVNVEDFCKNDKNDIDEKSSMMPVFAFDFDSDAILPGYPGGTKLNTCQWCPLRTSSSHCRVCRAEIEKKVLISMRIPNRFRGLYRLHLSTQPPITIVMKLTTIRSDGRVEAILITNSWSWRKSHLMSFRSVPSTRYGDCRLDQDSLDSYKEVRCRWIYAPQVAMITGVSRLSRPRSFHC